MIFDRAIVALDRSQMDKTLLAYSSFIAQLGRVKKMSFVHVLPVRESIWSDEEDADPVATENSLREESIRAELTQSVEASFTALPEVELEVSLPTGTPHGELVRLIQATKPGLLILGKKLVSHGSGVSAWKVVRQVETAIWFVTEDAKVEKQNLLVPVDFSENSFRALHAALHLKQQSDQVRITALHVVDVPLSASKAHRDKDAIIANLKASATNKFLRFLNEHRIERTGINLQLALNDKVDVASYIRQVAEERASDLIVIGGKGQSFLSNFLFGSVTEKLVTEEYDRPVLVIR